MVEGEKYNFKKAKDIGFCCRSRYLAGHPELKIIYDIVEDSISYENSILTFNLKSPLEPSPFLKFLLRFLDNSTFNIYLTEINPIKRRFRMKPLKSLRHPILSFSRSEGSLFVSSQDSSLRIQIFFSPFSLKVLKNQKEIITINSDSLLNFERYREKNEKMAHKPPVFIDATGVLTEANQWEDSFQGNSEGIKYGPSSVGVDFTFMDTQVLCGLPEHSDSVFLQDTYEIDPYRLFNLDVYAYPLSSTASIYGSIPFIFSKTVGLYWANPSETFLDIKSDPNSQTKRVHWFSECNSIDFYLFLSDSPTETIEKFTLFTGRPSFPPKFSLGYHQSRWNYFTQTEVLSLLHSFSKHLIPIDVIWLDIEYTDNKNYFTWDLKQFPSPIYLQDQLALNGIRLVCIIDPHFRYDPVSEVGRILKEEGILVKHENGEDFVGQCWSGTSAWVDFFNSKAREIWAGLYSLSNFRNSTTNLHIWNDMNEPSVFGQCEITFPRSCVHFGSVENREVHNMYGKMMQKATFKGLLKRSQGFFRPFLLSRSFFVGSQKYGAVWTGDNNSTWGYLKASVSMCLSIASCGISLCGADIGGFTGEPSEELMKRWHQLGAFLPFYRVHSNKHTKHREPWCYTVETMRNIRKSIIGRYVLLPYWYTLFYLYSEKGTPAIQSLFIRFPNQKNWEKIDEQYFVGDSLMVCPVLQPGLEALDVKLPPGRWFNYLDYDEIPSGSYQYSLCPDHIPIFIYAGGVIPTQSPGLSTMFMDSNPYTYIIALDFDYKAKGNVFLDDGESFEYKKTENFCFGQILMENLKIEYKVKGTFKQAGTLRSLFILGLPTTSVSIKSKTPSIEIEGLIVLNKVLEIHLKGFPMNQSWEIQLE